MKEKRGQITIFVVIAIIIVAAVILLAVLYMQGLIMPISEEESQQVLGSQVEPLRNYVAACVGAVSLDALEYLGEHGGYANYLENGLNSINFAGEKVIVVVRIENGFVNRLPSKSEFERQFALHMADRGKDKLDRCLDNFNDFKEQGFSVSPRSREITMNVKGETVDINVDWTIDLKKGRARIPVEQKSIRIPINVEKALRVANDIVNKEASGIAFEGLEYDKYVVENSLALLDINLVSQNYPTYNQKIFMITTEPKDPQEKEFRFYFAVDRDML